MDSVNHSEVLAGWDKRYIVEGFFIWDALHTPDCDASVNDNCTETNSI